MVWVAFGNITLIVGCAIYADDVALLAPSPSALRNIYAQYVH